jgi:hypothetical protein
LSQPAQRVEYVGPFKHHDVIVDGWRVPLLQAHPTDDGRVMLVLDRRLAAEFSAEEAQRIVPFVADAISVALGFGAHPREDTPRPLDWASRPRPERVHGITAIRLEAA